MPTQRFAASFKTFLRWRVTRQLLGSELYSRRWPGVYHYRVDWWKSILQVPVPRIAVVEDMDKPLGAGAFLGDMHAAILMAVGCVGYVSNGAVRELPRVRELGIQLFAGNIAVSHAFAHIVDFGSVVEIGGLEVHSGDLPHGEPSISTRRRHRRTSRGSRPESHFCQQSCDARVSALACTASNGIYHPITWPSTWPRINRRAQRSTTAADECGYRICQRSVPAPASSFHAQF